MSHSFEPIPGAIVASTDSFAPKILPLLHHETIRHLLLGSPAAVRQTILRLQTLHYSNASDWSLQMPIPGDRLMLTLNPGEVMSILVKQIWLE